jgi:hypothetical protein
MPQPALTEGEILQAADVGGAGVLISNCDANLFLDGSRTLTSKRSVSGMVFLDGFRSDVPLDYSPLPFLTKLSDVLDVCDDASREAHSLTVQNESARLALDSAFGGNEASELSCHVMHLNRMCFELRAAPKAVAMLIRRTYDRFHGRQRARVLADGKTVGWWYAPWENRDHRWAHDFFILPDPCESTVIEIDPVAGAPLWSVSRYEALSVLPA